MVTPLLVYVPPVCGLWVSGCERWVGALVIRSTYSSLSAGFP